jgi:para-nitrobenzyl esterase
MLIFASKGEEQAMQTSNLSRRGFLLQTGLAALAPAGLAALALPCRTLYAATSPTTVRTPNGILRGELSGNARVFRGVRFAEPPIGPLRFRAPVKARRWQGERDATRFGASAMQPGEPGIEHSEDCLTLNLWAPQGKGPFPVYVWVHGGGFTSGRAFEPMYDGTALAQAGVLCITVAYRLGVFGFLDMEPLLGPSYADSANNGLRDLITALEWVQENVAAFGGDPTRVTVGGESAGAKLTDTLLGVSSAQSLFQQAISESGGAERVATRADSSAVARGFGEEWRTRTGGELLSLQTAPADALIQVQHEFLRRWPQHFPLRAEIEGSLLPHRPVETIAGGASRGKRLLIGTNRDESALFIGPHPLHDPGAGDMGNLSPARFSEVFSKYRTVYPQMTDEALRIRSLTAEEYWIPSMRVADAHVKGGGKAWMYRLDFAEASGRLAGAAFHSLDVQLVWNRPSTLVANATAEAQLAVEMSQAWIAFLRGKAPGAPGLPAWPEYSSDARPTMVFDTQCRVEQAPQEAELRLWDVVL